MPFSQSFAMKRVLFRIGRVCSQQAIYILGVVSGKLALNNV